MSKIITEYAEYLDTLDGVTEIGVWDGNKEDPSFDRRFVTNMGFAITGNIEVGTVIEIQTINKENATQINYLLRGNLDSDTIFPIPDLSELEGAGLDEPYKPNSK